MFDGILPVYKEKDFTSFDVIAKLRGMLHQKKIGHAGTLDPMATGVLVLLLGNATKLSELLTEHDKSYKAVLTLGVSSDTDDATGSITPDENYENVKNGLDNESIIKAIKRFEGNIMQLPPIYSAIKKNGKKLYEYARSGQEIELEPRSVVIYSIYDIDINLPDISFTVDCGKGTYIRSLCRDIGAALGTKAVMSSLERISVDNVTLDDTHSLDEIQTFVDEGHFEDLIISTDKVLGIYPAADINISAEKLLINGNKLGPDDICLREERSLIDGDIIRIYKNNELYALYRYIEEDNVLKAYKMLGQQ